MVGVGDGWWVVGGGWWVIEVPPFLFRTTITQTNISHPPLLFYPPQHRPHSPHPHPPIPSPPPSPIPFPLPSSLITSTSPQHASYTAYPTLQSTPTSSLSFQFPSYSLLTYLPTNQLIPSSHLSQSHLHNLLLLPYLIT